MRRKSYPVVPDDNVFARRLDEGAMLAAEKLILLTHNMNGDYNLKEAIMYLRRARCRLLKAWTR